MRFGERLVRVRYLYDEARGRRLKTVEVTIDETPWRGPWRNDDDLVGVHRLGRNRLARRCE